MAGLIGTGGQIRRRAIDGFTEVSRLESQRNRAQDTLDAQKQAQEMQMIGTGAGIGGAYGVNKALALKDAAAGVGQMSSAVAAPVSQTTASLGTAVPGVNAAATGKAGAALSSAVPGAQAAAGGGLAAGGTGAAAGSSAAAGTGAAAASGSAAAGGAAAGSSGAMATLGAIAGPLAIGIGAAFLLNELFG